MRSLFDPLLAAREKPDEGLLVDDDLVRYLVAAVLTGNYLQLVSKVVCQETRAGHFLSGKVKYLHRLSLVLVSTRGR